jgi:hypothetical protein
VPGARIFPGTCPACGQSARFVEMKVEACLAPDEGPVKAWRGFKCMACGKKTKEVPSREGLHHWVGDDHVVQPQ